MGGDGGDGGDGGGPGLALAVAKTSCTGFDLLAPGAKKHKLAAMVDSFLIWYPLRTSGISGICFQVEEDSIVVQAKACNESGNPPGFLRLLKWYGLGFQAHPVSLWYGLDCEAPPLVWCRLQARSLPNGMVWTVRLPPPQWYGLDCRAHSLPMVWSGLSRFFH